MRYQLEGLWRRVGRPVIEAEKVLCSDIAKEISGDWIWGFPVIFMQC